MGKKRSFIPRYAGYPSSAGRSTVQRSISVTADLAELIEANLAAECGDETYDEAEEDNLSGILETQSETGLVVTPYTNKRIYRQAPRSRTPSSSSIPVPINQRNRTPSGAGGSSATSGRIQRSGSGVASNFDSRRTSKTTTSYGADGARITSTTTTFNTAGTSSAKSEGAFGQQTATRNW